MTGFTDSHLHDNSIELAVDQFPKILLMAVGGTTKAPEPLRHERMSEKHVAGHLVVILVRRRTRRTHAHCSVSVTAYIVCVCCVFIVC